MTNQKYSVQHYIPNRAKWRQWLLKNHDKEKVIWLIYYKKHTGKPTIPYDDAVEEALCFGWIDSTVKRIDDERYMQKFTPRNLKSEWSDLNIERVKELIKQGRMTKAGLDKIRPDILKRKPVKEKSASRAKDIPPFIKTFMKKINVWERFLKLAPSHQRRYVGWIMDAKKEETRERRLCEAIQMLKKDQLLGMK